MDLWREPRKLSASPQYFGSPSAVSSRDGRASTCPTVRGLSAYTYGAVWPGLELGHQARAMEKRIFNTIRR